MAATRFYFDSTVTPNITPSYDAGWELTAEALRLPLIYKKVVLVATAFASSEITIPITTTQDILSRQFISSPIPAQMLLGTFSLVIRTREVNAGGNATLAVVVKVVSQDGTVVRGTLFSTFNTDTEFGTTAATRIVNAQAITALTTLPGDRIAVEIGAHAAAPSVGTTFHARIGTADPTFTDFALTSGLTTALNAWCEFSQDLFNVDNNNYRSVRADSGISVAERVR